MPSTATALPRTERSLASVAASLLVLAALPILAACPASAQTTLLSNNFDTFTTGSTTDYYTVNNSDSAASGLSWQQPDSTTVSSEFSSYNGASTSYVYSDYENTTASSGTISAWLITPTLTYRNGDTISFYTRTTGNTQVYPDRLQVLFSASGTSTNVGSSSSSVGDFTKTLLDINSGLTTTGYPTTWTQETATISGLSSDTSGRIAFRYYVTNSGSSGSYGDYIGVDALSILRPAASATPEPIPLSLLALGGFALPSVALRRRTRSTTAETSPS